jgi:hypothetical protein
VWAASDARFGKARGQGRALAPHAGQGRGIAALSGNNEGAFLLQPQADHQGPSRRHYSGHLGILLLREVTSRFLRRVPGDAGGHLCLGRKPVARRPGTSAAGRGGAVPVSGRLIASGVEPGASWAQPGSHCACARCPAPPRPARRCRELHRGFSSRSGGDRARRGGRCSLPRDRGGNGVAGRREWGCDERRPVGKLVGLCYWRAGGLG